MRFRLQYLSLILLVAMACNTTPFSRWQTYAPEQDKLNDWEKIRIYKEQAVAAGASQHAALAKLYETQQDWAGALEEINEAIKVDPMNSYYHSLKSKYAHGLNDLSTAYREALTAYQLGSQSLQQSLILAKMAVALSEFSIVNNIIDSLAIVYPNDPEVLFMAARKHDKTGDLLQAEIYYRKVVYLNPYYQDNNYAYAEFLYRQKRFADAKNILHYLDTEAPNFNTLRLWADTYYQLNQADSALYFYRKSTTIKPDSIVFNAMLTIYSEQGKTDSVITICNKASTAYPFQKSYKLIAARALEKRLRYSESLRYYQEVYKMDSTDTLITTEIAILQRKMAYLQRKKDAERALQDSLEVQQLDSIM